MKQTITIIILSFLGLFKIVSAQVDVSLQSGNLAQIFRRSYYIQEIEYYLQMMDQTSLTYHFYSLQIYDHNTTIQQTLPLYYNNEGLQGRYSFVIFSTESENSDINIRLFIEGSTLTAYEQEIIAQELLHCSYTQSIKGVTSNDNYIFYFTLTDNSVLFYSLQLITMYTYTIGYYKMLDRQNYKYFYKEFYVTSNECLYRITFSSKELQPVEYFCVDNTQDSIISIEYINTYYLVINGENNVYVFYYDKLAYVQPKSQYILYKNGDSQMLMDLQEYTTSPILLGLPLNFGYYLTNNYFLLGTTEDWHSQSLQYLYQVRLGNAQNINLYKNKSEDSAIYTFQYFSSQNSNISYYIQDFDYDSGAITVSQFQQNINYDKYMDSNTFNNEVLTYITTGTLGFFSLFYGFLIKRRMRRRNEIKQEIEAIVFQTKYEMTKEQFYSKYELNLSDTLGSGGFGDVYKAKNLHKNIVKHKELLNKMHDEYACKKIIYNKDESFEEQKRQVNNEISILERLMKFDYVINLTNYFVDETQTIIAFELAESNLQKEITEKQEDIGNTRFEEADIVKFLDQIGNTLADIYLIEQIAHRDIKPENILIKGGDYFISDFGISSQVSAVKSKENIVLGTIKWMSPELKNIKIEEFKNLDIDLFKSDMFSLGLILLYMLTLIDISQVNQNEDFKKKRMSALKFNRKDIDSIILTLISKMLDFNTEKRPDPQIFKKSLEDIKTNHQKKLTEKNG